MTLEQLRLLHPRLIYKAYTVETTGKEIIITHEFVLEPDIVFRPTVSIPFAGEIDRARLAPYAFALGMAESISYWKAACPGELVVAAGYLSDAQVRFWQDLYLHGLGEFYYRNGIPFDEKNFFRITVSAMPEEPEVSDTEEAVRHTIDDMVFVGGGKDSAVTLGLLAASTRRITVLAVNPTKAAEDVIHTSGVTDPVVVRRTIDPVLLALNRKGYLNGHTPYSAYLSFLGALVGFVYDVEHAIVSNERSANEGNVVYRGIEVNHQYSKSFRYEEAFRTYAANFLPQAPEYFSMLRPLGDLQIARLFAGFPEYFPSFRSCNTGGKMNSWCGKCPKCAFTYLVLSPFLSHEEMRSVFGHEYFDDADILFHIRGLTGLTPVKPFDCVGTRDESRLAVLLAVDRYIAGGREVPAGLLTIKSEIAVPTQQRAHMEETVLTRWGDTYNLPAAHMAILRSAWQNKE